MDQLIRIGRLLFAVAMTCFGVECILFASGVAKSVPGPPWTQGSTGLAWLAGVGFIAAAVCIALRWQGRMAANLLGVGILLRLLFIHVPGLVARLRDPNRWTSTFEVLAMGGAALVLAGMLPVKVIDSGSVRSNAQSVAVEVGRYLFAIALAVFGSQHFMYPGFIATLIPSWIPWHLFWAYFFGAAFIAAAVSIATGTAVRLTAALLGVMFLLWVVVLHAPRIAAAPHNGNEWTSGFVALAMCGAAFVLAERRSVRRGS